MRYARGDIWKLSTSLDAIVIPTNIGYTRDGRNVMGRGLALQANKRYPGLDAIYGDVCMKHKERTPLWRLRPNGAGVRTLLLFPVKPFNAKAPQLSWQASASIELIEQSLRQLAEYVMSMSQQAAEMRRAPTNVFIPDVGCGNGQLKVAEVRPLISKYLGHFDTAIHITVK